MLDDLKYIHQIDSADALGVIEKQWQQLTHSFGVSAPQNNGILNVVLSGMGGSAWPAMYIQTWPGLQVPFEVSRTYGVPAYVNEKTLFIASSYSGNTEETLSALSEAENRGATIIVMTAGGELEKRAIDAEYPLYKIPGGIQPRMSSFYFIAAFLELFEPLGLLQQNVSLQERRQLSEWLSTFVASWRADSPTADNHAKQLALEIAGTTPIIYSGPLLAPVANKMKICMNENAKNTAWWGQFPEFSHNEFIGWSGHPVEKPFSIVDIRSGLDHDRIKKRFDITERMLSGKRPAPLVITPQGDSTPQQIFYTSMLCDFICTYVALLNGVDPTPVDLVEKFKAELNT
jgi:glucose/mannose-6-phosphate isomerase